MQSSSTARETPGADTNTIQTTFLYEHDEVTAANNTGSSLTHSAISQTCEETLESQSCPQYPLSDANLANKPTETRKQYMNFMTFVEILAALPDSTLDMLGVQLDDLVLDCQVAGRQCSRW